MEKSSETIRYNLAEIVKLKTIGRGIHLKNKTAQTLVDEFGEIFFLDNLD